MTNIIIKMADDVEGEAQQPFRLLDLPPELWSRVCYFATASVQHPATTRTCRTLRAEALPMYYAKMEFAIWDDCENGWAFELFKWWMDAIGPRNRDLMKRFTIEMPWQIRPNAQDVYLWGCWTNGNTESFAWGLDVEPLEKTFIGCSKKATIFERH
ncbi:hypothetical protein EJ03DRAFT_347912 [Teratosphaeria nubilosa]|uniref:Uncharacterized protein n=1 Tax=Teratosphaeria nubilosa TaxID=161662 RepID=A0A6G1LLG4_9PEZI|nr:hypothetical protein EJ03DRAFT_347912 [Teratosphaeria nubilosa]